jgi:hypothetical protein
MGKECLVVGVQPAITLTPGTSQFVPLDKQAGKFENRPLGPTNSFQPFAVAHVSEWARPIGRTASDPGAYFEEFGSILTSFEGVAPRHLGSPW